MRGFERLSGVEAPHIAAGISHVESSPILSARSGDGIVFLDRERDEYSCCYDPEADIGLYSDLSGRVGIDDVDRPALESRWSDPCSSDAPRPSVAHLARFGIAIARAGIRFPRRSLEELGSVARRLGTGKARSAVTPQQAANLFRIFLSLTPFQPECLFRSFALLHFLDSYGLRADWVFGVQLFPFRAHCWVAAGDLLLNEFAHGIEDYEVIWTVRPDHA